MEKLLKNKPLIILPIIVLVVAIYLVAASPVEQINIRMGIEKFNEISSKKNDLTIKQDKLESLKRQKATEQENEKEKKSKSGKVIYGVSGQQFSAEASFGIIFENLLANMTNSGIRIRSIEYNYQPADDKILATNLGGYNACELSFVTVGSYSQFQTLFKNIAKEQYLSNIYEVYIEPFDKDKSILITRFKIRLYTKTI